MRRLQWHQFGIGIIAYKGIDDLIHDIHDGPEQQQLAAEVVFGLFLSLADDGVAQSEHFKKQVANPMLRKEGL